ncbi:cyclic nucleotide-binding domain-containing protein, partial [Candidatus Marithioploca araucensis]|nr:cyclic nucleotide-binding domain-containing protein [Candidatus Marithioploca araucensis]
MENASQVQSIPCKIPIFMYLNEEKQRELIAQAKTVYVEQDEVLFEEGDIGHSMYVIQSGAVRVLTTTEAGQQILLTTLGAGECFGEQALQSGRTEDKRDTSVIATEPSQLLKITVGDYQAVLSQGLRMEPKLKQINEEQLRKERAKQSALLNSPLDQGGMELLEEQVFEDGEMVFQEGDVGNQFYLILEGIAKVTKTEGGHEKLLSRLNRGQYFGEAALVRNEARAVTVRAEGKLRVNCFMGSTHDVSKLTTMDNLTAMYHIPKEDKAASGKPIAYKHYGVDELSFKVGPLVGITAFGEWPDVGHVESSGEQAGEMDDSGQDLIKESGLSKSITFGEENIEWLEELKFDDGSVLFREGDIADRFYLILSGMAKVTKKEGTGEKLVALLCRGQYFGEVALIRNEPRAVTVTAEGPLRVASLKGLITFHTSQFMGMDSLTTMYHFSEGEKVISTKVVDQAIFDVTRISSTVDMPIVYKRPGIRREIFSLYGRLMGMTVIGEWPDLGRVIQLIIREKRVWPWQFALFRQKGELWLERERESFKSTAVICKCTGVTRGVLNQAVADGCDSVEQLAERTGASRVCGSCAPLLAEIVGRSDMEPVDIVSVLPVTHDVKSFRFRPRNVPVSSILPGQHIRIEAQIAGRWVQRSYTLTSAIGQEEYYEITVKREEHGLFSRWLHDEMNTNSSVRVSKPQGGYYLSLDEKTPVVCFSGGIGVTPALAMLRSLHKMDSERLLYIDYSAQTREQFAYVNEFQDISNQRENIHVNLRATREQGVIQPKEVKQTVQKYPDASFYICGPQVFEQAICTHLEDTGVEKEKIKTEQFVPAGGSTAAMPKLEGAKTLLFGSLLTFILAMLFVAFGPIPYSSSVQTGWQIETLWTDNIWKQITGYTILALTVIGMTMSFRKRLRSFRIGNFAWWRLMHIGTALLALALLFVHTGMSAGEHFNFLLMVSFVGALIIGTGVSLLVFIESRLPEATTTYQIKTWLKNAHIAIVWPLPVLIAIHIVLAYYF